MKVVIFGGDGNPLSKEDVTTLNDLWNAPWVNADGTTTPKEGNTWVIAHNEGVDEMGIRNLHILKGDDDDEDQVEGEVVEVEVPLDSDIPDSELSEGEEQ